MLAYALVSKPCSEATNMMISLFRFLTVDGSDKYTATKVIYLNYPAPGFCLLQPKRNKSHKQGNSPTKPIDRLQKSLYNSSVLTYFILRVKNGGEDNEVFY